MTRPAAAWAHPGSPHTGSSSGHGRFAPRARRRGGKETLFGRVRAEGPRRGTTRWLHTYDEFAAYWPNADPNDPFTAVMNGARKYVVSTTIKEAGWENSTVVNGDVKAELEELKEHTSLGTTGSATLVQWLLEQGLLDELHLLVHPVVVGKGKKLFADGAQVPLRLKSSTQFSTGVLHLVYGPAQPEPQN